MVSLYALRAKDKLGFCNDFLENEDINIILNNGTEIFGTLINIGYKEFEIIDIDDIRHKIKHCDVKYVMRLE